MRQLKKSENHNPLGLAGLFCLLVFFLLFISAVFKIGNIVQNSLFDGDHRFTMLSLFASQKKSGDIISFSPESKTISVLHVKSKNDISNKTTGIFWGIPIDAYIISSNYLSIQNNKDIADLLKAGIFSSNFNGYETNLTIVDSLRLLFFVKATSSYSVTIKNSNTFVSNQPQLDDSTVDTNIAKLFIDETIVNEKASIIVVNATGVSLLGTRFARLINDMGGNVIAVKTAEVTSKKSLVSYVPQKSYTAERLAKFLHSNLEVSSQNGISDIIMTVGQDSISLFSF